MKWINDYYQYFHNLKLKSLLLMSSSAIALASPNFKLKICINMFHFIFQILPVFNFASIIISIIIF